MSAPHSRERPIDERTGTFTSAWYKFITRDTSSASTDGGSSLPSVVGFGLYVITRAGAAVRSIVSSTLSVVNGNGAGGNIRIELANLPDIGVGDDGLVKITRDAYGRIEGTAPATAEDLAFDDAVMASGAADVQAALFLALGARPFFADDAPDPDVHPFWVETVTMTPFWWYDDGTSAAWVNLTGAGGGGAAVDVTYDNTASGLTATDVQAAIDEIAAGGGGGGPADTDALPEGATNKYFTDERAQDAVGTILVDSSTIDFTYSDATPSITASIVAGSIGATELASTAVAPGSYTNTNLTVDADGRITAASNGSGGGAMSWVATATVAGSAAQSITISSLDLATDIEYYIQFSIDNANGSSQNINLYCNGDTTDTNYERQTLNANANVVTAARANSPVICSVAGGENACGFLRVQLDFDGKMRAYSCINRDSGTLVRGDQTWVVKLAAANVTSITLQGSVAGNFAIGSTMRIYRVKP